MLVPVFVFVDSRFFGDPAVNGDERGARDARDDAAEHRSPGAELQDRPTAAPRPAPRLASVGFSRIRRRRWFGRRDHRSDEFGQGLELGLVQVSLPRGVPRGHRRSVRARIARHDRLERACRSHVCADRRRHRRSSVDAPGVGAERGVRGELDAGQGPRDRLEGPTERLGIRDRPVGHFIRASVPRLPSARAHLVVMLFSGLGETSVRGKQASPSLVRCGIWFPRF